MTSKRRAKYISTNFLHTVCLEETSSQPLTRASDGTGFRNGSKAPAAARLTAALHFCHSARELLCTATIHQAWETCAWSLIWTCENKIEGMVELSQVLTSSFHTLEEVKWSELFYLISSVSIYSLHFHYIYSFLYLLTEQTFIENLFHATSQGYKHERHKADTSPYCSEKPTQPGLELEEKQKGNNPTPS